MISHFFTAPIHQLRPPARQAETFHPLGSLPLEFNGKS